MTQFLLRFLLVLIVPTLSCAASFNCATSSTTVERMICRDKLLSSLDEQVGQLYRHAIQDVDKVSEVKDEQVLWLKSVRNKCTSESCLTDAYRGRIRVLSFDCAASRGEFDDLVCSAPDERNLAEIFQRILDEWMPYLTKISYYPVEQQQALNQWYKATEPLLSNWTKGCLTIRCYRAKIAEAIERWSFPSVPYEALLKWIEQEGGSSPLLAPGLWKLTPTEAVPVWGISTGIIYRIGPTPAWLTVKGVDVPPNTPPPFLGRSLTYTEAVNLDKLVTNIFPWSWDKVTVSGITYGMRNSLHLGDGGGAKCSRNPLFSGVSISGRFPDPPDSPNSTRANSFKIIEVIDVALVQSIPTCAFGEPYQDGFFPKNKGSYKSQILIDDIRDQFIRPDGSFWLKLSDDNWYRFRRNMTSEAPEIGVKYHIFLEPEFEAMLDKSKNIKQLEKLLMEAIERRKHD